MRVATANCLISITLAACFTQQASAVLRSQKQRADPPLKASNDGAIAQSSSSIVSWRDKVNPLEKVGKGMKDMKDIAKEKATRPGPKRPMMDSIEVMRAMMCWGRPKLIEHEKCMKWMTDNCQEETTGEGYCKKLRRYVKAECRKGVQKACNYAKDMGIKVNDAEQIAANDEDGDGVPDSEDAFPDNPLESKDSDGDGVGDNMDEFPYDPSCNKEGDVCKGVPAKPSGIGGAVAAAPSPASAPAPAGSGLTMSESNPLPSQGFDEFSNTWVSHDDGTTMTGDWRREWPKADKTEDESVASICEKNPKLAWCKLKLSKKARKQYASSHP